MRKVYRGRDVEVSFGPPRPGDLKARVVSTDRARDELGWIPRVSFDEGMRVRATLRVRTETELRHGIERDEVSPWFQPL